ncbi:MAG: energy-coupled thiamine transporter ThiT, partial [Limnochordia bacterium]
MKRFNLYVQVEVAVAVALAVALSFWKVLTMPQGGSVSLDMIPLLLLAARRGTPVGLLGGLLFGLIKLLLG